MRVKGRITRVREVGDDNSSKTYVNVEYTTKEGETFECKLSYDHGVPPATVTVHIENDDGRVSFGPSDFKFRR